MIDDYTKKQIIKLIEDITLCETKKLSTLCADEIINLIIKKYKLIRRGEYE